MIGTNQESPLQQAQALISAGKPDQAGRILRQNLGDPACAVRLRELLVGEGRNQQAAELARSMADRGDTEAHVSRSFLALLGGDPQTALQECQAALQMQPQSATAHNHAGRALNNLGRPQDAFASLKRAVDCDPGYPEAWHNLGHVLRVMGDLPVACEAYQHALKIAPGYRSARLNLGKSLFNQEKITDALACFEALLEHDAKDVEALVDAGLAYHLLGELEQSKDCYDRALALDDRNPVAYCYLGMLLNELQDADAAVSALQSALRLDPHDIEAWVELAGTHELCNRLDEAAGAVQRGLAIDPAYAPLQLEAAKLERRRGDFAAAVQRLRRIDPQQLPARLRKPYHFELANALDRTGETDAAYHAFAAGNRLSANDVRRRHIDPESFARTCGWIERWINAGAPGLKAAASDPQEDLGENLCFLVGFTRSGTTLLDMMLDAHPGVASIEEKATLESVIRSLHALPGGYPSSMADIDAGLLTRLRGQYRAEAEKHGVQGASLVLDKMPMRFLHAGLINRLFPRARVIFSLRHPCDVVLSNFMQQYPSNTDFQILFDTLEQGAGVFDLTFRIWEKLEPLLENRPEYFRYEDLVADPGEALQRVCAYLGIESSQAMLDTAARMETRERVTTPSYQQVSEPIYGRAAGRWLRYRRYLEPCLPLLRPHIERYGYSAGD